MKTKMRMIWQHFARPGSGRASGMIEGGSVDKKWCPAMHSSPQQLGLRNHLTST